MTDTSAQQGQNNLMGCDTTKHDGAMKRVQEFLRQYGEVFADENVIAEIRGGGRTHQLRHDDLAAISQDAADSWSAASSLNGDVTKFAGDLEKANAEIERLRAALANLLECTAELNPSQGLDPENDPPAVNEAAQALKGGA